MVNGSKVEEEVQLQLEKLLRTVHAISERMRRAGLYQSPEGSRPESSFFRDLVGQEDHHKLNEGDQCGQARDLCGSAHSSGGWELMMVSPQLHDVCAAVHAWGPCYR